MGAMCVFTQQVVQSSLFQLSGTCYRQLQVAAGSKPCQILHKSVKWDIARLQSLALSRVDSELHRVDVDCKQKPRIMLGT